MKAYDTIPATVLDRLKTLGGHIKTARLRRKYSSRQLAEMAGTTRETIRRLENGHPGVGMGYLASVLWALQLDDDLERIASPATDTLGQALSAADLPQRIKARDDRYDF